MGGGMMRGGGMMGGGFHGGAMMGGGFHGGFARSAMMGRHDFGRFDRDDHRFDRDDRFFRFHRFVRFHRFFPVFAAGFPVFADATVGSCFVVHRVWTHWGWRLRRIWVCG
jgi:hypothetical protein